MKELLHSAHLTKTQRIIAEYVLDNASEACFMTSTEIALKLGVSESSVIRFSRTIGFDGFMDFQKIILETIVSGGHNFFKDTLGEHGAEYIPYLMTVTLYIGIANLIGLLGFKPPTKDMNATAALAFMSIVLIEVAGIRQKGAKGWVKSFAEPIPIILPINIMEIFIKPLSLCMRLFGNVLGSFVIMELLKLIVPAVLPAVFSCYFDIFDGLIQAYVFVFLTSLFIKEATE